MSFETEAELSLTVDEGDLRNVQQQIEEGIGTTEVGVTDGGSMSAQSGGGRAGRRSMRLAETRTELLEDAVVFLEEIEDQVGTGDGGGGGLITELIGVGGETAGDVAVETGDTVADAVSDVITGTVSTTLGNTIASAINGSEVEVEDVDPLPVEDPSPLAVEDPSPLAVEEPDPVDVNVTVDVTGSGGGGGGSVSSDRGGGGLPPAGQVTRDILREIPGGDAIADIDRAFTRRVAEIAPGTSPDDLSSFRQGAPPPVKNNVTSEPQIEIAVDPDSIVNEVESAIDEATDRVKADLRDEISQLETDIDTLERDIRRGGGSGP